MELEAQTSKRSSDGHNSNQLHTTHVYNQWFSPFSHNTTSDMMRLQSGSEIGGRAEKGHSFMVFYIFLGLLACLDLVLILHRMLKAKIVGQLLLYGFPEYMDFRERKGETERGKGVAVEWHCSVAACYPWERSRCYCKGQSGERHIWKRGEYRQFCYKLLCFNVVKVRLLLECQCRMEWRLDQEHFT